jgi:hypothetical protein
VGIESAQIVVNISPIDLFYSHVPIRTREFVWHSNGTSDLELALGTYMALKREGWTPILESPIDGISRSYRMPVVGVKGKTVILVKPVLDSKKVNKSGLKLIEAKKNLELQMPTFEVIPVVIAFLGSFDDNRRTSFEYDIWLKERSWLT